MWNVAGTKTLVLNALGGTVTYTVSGAVTNGGTMFAQIDTMGFDSAVIELQLSPMNTTSNCPSLITLGEADATASVGGAGISDITAFHGLTATATNCGWLIPATGVDTTTGSLYRFSVDCRGRKRYLFLTANPRTTSYGLVHVSLGKPEKVATTAAGMGADAVVEG